MATGQVPGAWPSILARAFQPQVTSQGARPSARSLSKAQDLSLSGSITALATPFTAAGALDLDAWHRLLRQQIDGGTEGVVVAGSTGEAAALDDVEYDSVLKSAVEAIAGRIPVLAGTGQMNTARTIAQTRR